MGSSRAHDGDTLHPGALAQGHDPIAVEDIDEVLHQSADAGTMPSGDAPPWREWREDLTVALAALAYAREILTSDTAILHSCLAKLGVGGPDTAGLDELVDRLPGLLTSQEPSHQDPGDMPGSPSSNHPPTGDGGVAEIVMRADRLVAAHQHMAGTDLTSPTSLARTLRHLEAALVIVAERQGAVVARLAQVRAAIVRQYAPDPGRDSSSLDTPA